MTYGPGCQRFLTCQFVELFTSNSTNINTINVYQYCTHFTRGRRVYRRPSGPWSRGRWLSGHAGNNTPYTCRNRSLKSPKRRCQQVSTTPPPPTKCGHVKVPFVTAAISVLYNLQVVRMLNRPITRLPVTSGVPVGWVRRKGRQHRDICRRLPEIFFTIIRNGIIIIGNNNKKFIN